MNADRSVAIITPSYAVDFDRCQLLCESMDAHVSGIDDHYILVDDEDFKLFSALAGKHRHIVNERDILPDWLHVMRSGFGPAARKAWVSTRALPMRGWHVQQLRRIAIAAHIEHASLLYCDSDMFFVRAFDGQALWQGDDLRLYCKPLGITSDMEEHRKWLGTAHQMNGLSTPVFPHDDYINNLVSWRRETVLAMCRHIETISGRDWVSTIARSRTFSECLIYGCYVDGVLQENSRHWHGDIGLCLTYWSGEALDKHTLKQFVDQMDERQFALGIQSFTNTDTAMLRQFLNEAA
jgi:hypothetical protein